MGRWWVELLETQRLWSSSKSLLENRTEEGEEEEEGEGEGLQDQGQEEVDRATEVSLALFEISLM